jgi:hypothetical protein
VIPVEPVVIPKAVRFKSENSFGPAAFKPPSDRNVEGICVPLIKCSSFLLRRIHHNESFLRLITHLSVNGVPADCAKEWSSHHGATLRALDSLTTSDLSVDIGRLTVRQLLHEMQERLPQVGFDTRDIQDKVDNLLERTPQE